MGFFDKIKAGLDARPGKVSGTLCSGFGFSESTTILR